MTGTLYGIGVGPGAPDLLTLRAVAVLRKVDVILAAASPRNDYSAALETARPHLRPETRLFAPGISHDPRCAHPARGLGKKPRKPPEKCLRAGKARLF